MDKYKAVGMVILGVLVIYGVLAIFISFLSDQTVATNAALAAASNMERYPGTSGFLLSTPWILYLLPAIFGIGWIIFILKRRPIV